MANEMPDPESYTGLSRQVLRYSDRFSKLASRVREPEFGEADWAGMEELVDTANFERNGVFLTAQSETIDWPTYKGYITKYAGGTTWEGTLRRITEVPGLVFLELTERNTREGVTDISNTVTIYEFGEDEKLRRLHVYVSHVG